MADFLDYNDVSMEYRGAMVRIFVKVDISGFKNFNKFDFNFLILDGL